MKFNDILDSVNTALEGERVIKDLFVRGHLVSTMEIKKLMGPYKQSYIKIVYVNLDESKNIEFLTSTYMGKAPVDKMDEFILESEKRALLKLIITLHTPGIWQSLIEGKYGTE